MAWTVTIYSAVIGDGTSDNPYRPAFADQFTNTNWSDVSDGDTPAGKMTLEVTGDDEQYPGYEIIKKTRV